MWLAGWIDGHMNGLDGWVSGGKEGRTEVKEPQPWLCKA